MKRKYIFLLIIVVIISLASTSAFAEESIAVSLWNEMAQAGGRDLTDAWEMYGLFTFGETTGDGELTANMTEDGQALRGSITFRIYPKKTEEITHFFFPAYRVLLAHLITPEEEQALSDWLDSAKEDALKNIPAKNKYRSDTKDFACFSVHIQYDVKYNELYSLITPTVDTDYLRVKD